jgi:hypothetical protein
MDIHQVTHTMGKINHRSLFGHFHMPRRGWLWFNVAATPIMTHFSRILSTVRTATPSAGAISASFHIFDFDRRMPLFCSSHKSCLPDY